MTISSTNIFDLICDKVKDYKGYTLVEIPRDGNESCTIYHYDTKEEFDKDFTTKKHTYYPSSMLSPINITNDYGDSKECLVGGHEVYIDFNNLYLFVDGKMSR